MRSSSHSNALASIVLIKHEPHGFTQGSPLSGNDALLLKVYVLSYRLGSPTSTPAKITANPYQGIQAGSLHLPAHMLLFSEWLGLHTGCHLLPLASSDLWLGHAPINGLVPSLDPSVRARAFSTYPGP